MEGRDRLLRARHRAAAPAAFPDGTPAKLAPGRDPREVFADWLITPKNPWFTRNIVNRVWSWLLGRGIIQEPDDIRPDNPARESRTARVPGAGTGRVPLRPQAPLSADPEFARPTSSPPFRAATSAEAAANFAHYPLRRLDAEVLIDAICQITGTTETYTSAIPEPFTFIPDDQRSISLPDGSITSTFLELFGRPSRDTGLEAERNNRLTAAQRLHLLNSSHVQRKIEQSPKFQSMIREFERWTGAGHRPLPDDPLALPHGGRAQNRRRLHADRAP